MRTKRSLSLIPIAALALAACSGSVASPSADTASSATPKPVAVVPLSPSAVPVTTPSPVGSASTEPSPSAGGAGSPGTVSIDPCSLLTADEASTAIGMKLSAGVVSQLDPDRVCTFKNGTSEVKIILAPPAPDAATAQSYWDAERSQVPAEVNVQDLKLFDRSAYGSASAAGRSLSALFVIDGTTFFDFYCGFPACTKDASVAAVQLIAGRLP